MMIHTEQYLGKTIRIKGQYDSAQDPDTGTTFFGVVVMDALCYGAWFRPKEQI